MVKVPKDWGKLMVILGDMFCLFLDFDQNRVLGRFASGHLASPAHQPGGNGTSVSQCLPNS